MWGGFSQQIGIERAIESNKKISTSPSLLKGQVSNMFSVIDDNLSLLIHAVGRSNPPRSLG